MDAFEYLKKQERDKETKFLSRFGPCPPTLRTIRDHSDLESLRAAGQGFVINIRDDRSRIHRVTCESIEVMSTSAYPKIFVQTGREAVQWIETDTGKVPWEHCGRCGGASSYRGTQI
jgi:hypothetical protein